ncbi:hypothetical protein HME9302_01847 [Alteripontixanthobacter maritimus]|uniref:Galactosyltransferase C-terminal domain-containing protein n=1 Tax=Alteripontixanthobacter maritimus TaxID=2161824 RepID=A0A369Q6Z9_9SPHN|nr:galactosyltransferase-related protein [Alteripontixanthobacter maritimus]RDC60633.1 hypothetical protein HME9302_01847 [Alteripontixanthobacter maritimus]
MTTSVCTLAFGRDEHLTNLVRGLAQSTVHPDELVIAVMQENRYDLPDCDFPVRQIMMGSSGIPLAEARNVAAAEAIGDLLIYLDVDCIPNPDLVGDYIDAAKTGDGVFMGEVAYLPSGATASVSAADNGFDYAAFDRVGVRHSERRGPPEGQIDRCSDYRCFWSLNFAISAEDFAATGGFDENYVGYGGEDTDFGRVVATSGLPIWWVRGAKAYHQYHPHHMPPVHHIDSVLANVHRFVEKWGEETMDHWLKAFSLMGLAERSEAGWRKLRDPNEADLALTRQQSHQPYASSATVLEVLEAEAVGATGTTAAGRAMRAAPEIAAS